MSSDLKLTSQLIGKHCLQLLIADKAISNPANETYNRAVNKMTLEFAQYYQEKQKLELIGIDYITNGFEETKRKFNEGFYSIV